MTNRPDIPPDDPTACDMSTEPVDSVMRELKRSPQQTTVTLDKVTVTQALDSVRDATHDFGAGPVPAHRHVNPDGTTGGWVADTAYVADTVFVGPDAQVFNQAVVSGRAWVYGQAKVYDRAVVFDQAQVCDQAKVLDEALVFGEAMVCDKAKVYDQARVFGRGWVWGHAWVGARTVVCGTEDR